MQIENPSTIRKIKNFLRNFKLTSVPYKTISSLKNKGLKLTFRIIYEKLFRKFIFNHAFGIKISKEEREIQETTVFKRDIKFSIIVPLYNTPNKFLKEMIDSVISQTYNNWELCLADGSDENHQNVGAICKEYANNDERIKYKKLSKNLGISENTNAAIEMSTGEYIALFDHDDLLHPTALFYYRKEIENFHSDFIYCDELVFLSQVNNSIMINLKPDFAPDNLRANNYICHFSVFKKSLFDKVGGFRKEFDGSQDHDMILRLTEKAEKITHIPRVLYYWRSHPNSVAMDLNSKSYAIDAGINAVSSHLKRSGLSASVESTKLLPTTYRIKYELSSKPLISIIIPNKDQRDMLKRCVDSILEFSTYENFEIIIVENNSETSEIFNYYESLNTIEKIKVVHYKGDFNFSKINNFGFKYCKGEHIILLNNDTEIITANWIEEMLMYNQRDDVAVTGAMLYFPNDTIQHAGVIVGIGGTAGHAHKAYKRGDLGYIGRLYFPQNLSAVTGACMMVKSSVYRTLDGLDPLFKVAYNDIDFCLRVRALGYLICFTPYAELYHYESISRGFEDTPEKKARLESEGNLLRKRHNEIFENGDPYYNKNLSLEREDFSLRLYKT